MADEAAFQADAFQNDAFQVGDVGGEVYPPNLDPLQLYYVYFGSRRTTEIIG